jgi:hypothetical protein
MWLLSGCLNKILSSSASFLLLQAPPCSGLCNSWHASSQYRTRLQEPHLRSDQFDGIAFCDAAGCTAPYAHLTNTPNTKAVSALSMKRKLLMSIYRHEGLWPRQNVILLGVGVVVVVCGVWRARGERANRGVIFFPTLSLQEEKRECEQELHALLVHLPASSLYLVELHPILSCSQACCTEKGTSWVP